MLKHCLLALMLAGLVYAVPPSVAAQESGSDGQQSAPQPEYGRGHHHFDPARRAEMLTKQLNLTSEQQPKVLDILKSEQSQMESLRSDSSVSREDRRPKMMEIRKTSDDQIRALLDSNQQKKWGAMQSRQEHWREQRHEGQAPGATPDSSKPQ